jgi:hypothetical protein
MLFTGNLIWLSVAYAPFKHISKCQIVPNKKFCVCISTFYVRPWSFSGMCKKTKKMSREKHYYRIKFYLFYIEHTKWQFFVKQVCARLWCPDVCVTFKKTFQNMLKLYFIKESICTQEIKHRSNTFLKTKLKSFFAEVANNDITFQTSEL